MHQANSFNPVDRGGGFSPIGTPSQVVQNLPHQQSQSPHRHPHPQLHHPHPHPGTHSPHSHHHAQQQRTPVQSHAQLPAFNPMYPPLTSPSLFGPPGSSIGNLSVAAVALDLHGFQYQHHVHGGGNHGTSMGSLGLSPGNVGVASYHQIMDQYMNFDTNALDLATAVQPSATGPSFASLSHQGNSPQAPTTVSPDRKHSTHLHSTQASSQPAQKHPFQSPAPSPHHPTDTHSVHHLQNLFNYGNPINGMTSMDDSMITQSPYSSQNHQQSGGNPRRESFSYGTTTGPPQPMSVASMIPLSRVHSAGSAGGSPWHPHGGNGSLSSGNNVASSRDATMKVRNPKRSSWDALRSLAGASS